MTVKHAATDHPIQAVLTERWSPYVFDERAVATEDLQSLFEAARWAASSYNEQPWRYIVATRAEADEYQRLLSCLVEPNQAWAGHAPVLALGVVHHRFVANEAHNPAAEHDLGLAAGNLVAEATARGLAVHQMIGILPERARELYAIPETSAALTALAIGYPGDPAAYPETLGARDQTPRERKPLREFVFSERWGNGASWV